VSEPVLVVSDQHGCRAKDARGRCGRKADRPCAGDIDRRSGADLGGDGSMEIRSAEYRRGRSDHGFFSLARASAYELPMKMPATARRLLQLTPNPYQNDTLTDAFGPPMCGQGSGLRDALGSGS
jgi:hypothetical protein